MKVLVRTGGKKRYRAKVHFYDAENDRALCQCYGVGPNNPDWEVQDVTVEQYYQIKEACWKCRQLLTPPPLKPTRQPRKSPRKMLRLAEHEAEMGKLKRWNEASIQKGE
jgi:hypothetical protein